MTTTIEELRTEWRQATSTLIGDDPRPQPFDFEGLVILANKTIKAVQGLSSSIAADIVNDLNSTILPALNGILAAADPTNEFLSNHFPGIREDIEAMVHQLDKL